MIPAPPLTHVTGAVELAEVYGAFGPASALTWVGACVGMCGARPGCREECPAPECSGCGRARHGITHDGGAIGRITPVPARVLPGELDDGQPVDLSAAEPVKQPVTVLRPAVDISPQDASLPAAVAGLLQLAAAHGHRARVTASVGMRGGAVVAALAVRVSSVGCAVYERTGDGWRAASAMLIAPHLRRANVTAFAAALSGVEYVPPAPRPPAERGPCPGCGAEVSLTKAGAVRKNHKCGKRAVEGRS